MQLSFNKFFYQANTLSNSHFDQLFVPFRTVYSNVEKGDYEYMSQGILANHIRASMNVPLIFPKFYINEQIKYDGGIYNNFPIRVMQKEFNPNHIIGVQTGGNLNNDSKITDLKTENISYLFSKILVNNSDYKAINPKTDVFIHPKVSDLSSFDFKNYKKLIQIGEESVRSKLPELRKKIKRKAPIKWVNQKRSAFLNRFDSMDFDSLAISSKPYLKNHTYHRKILQPKKKDLTTPILKKAMAVWQAVHSLTI